MAFDVSIYLMSLENRNITLEYYFSVYRRRDPLFQWRLRLMSEIKTAENPVDALFKYFDPFL